MKMLVHGALGTMGRLLVSLIEASNHDVIKVDPRRQEDGVFERLEEAPLPDVIVDFSHASHLESIRTYALTHHIPIVLATTGYDDNGLKNIASMAQTIPVFFSANLSVGVTLLAQMLKSYTRMLEDAYDIEISETHHRHKQDAPSGTAYLLARAIEEGASRPKRLVLDRTHAPKEKDDIGLSVMRGGSVVGEHTVHFYGLSDSLHFTHKAYTKTLFAEGALIAARFIVTKPHGLYTMSDLLSERGNTHE